MAADGPAPEFTLTDTNGGTHSLSDFRGRYVILEWLNYSCPFVRKHYGSGSMQATQTRWTEEGAVWLAIVSSAPGKQGHFSNEAMNRRSEEQGGRQTAILMDEDGQVGRAFGARTTPQMVVISPEGVEVALRRPGIRHERSRQVCALGQGCSPPNTGPF